jgi:lipid-A-disaccharide synthase
MTDSPGRGTVLDLYITANSPGEISGWVEPVVRELRARVRSCRITLVILPCQYASGEELTMGVNAGADRCARIGGIGPLLREAGDNPSPGGVNKKLVLHLGGDFMFSVYLSKRISAPLWAYASRPRWSGFVDKFFVPDDGAERRFRLMGVRDEKFEKIGTLALDSVVLSESEEETRSVLGIGGDELILALLMGSRPIEYTEGVGLFLGVARIVQRAFPELRIVIPLAESVREEIFQESLKRNGVEWRGETMVRELAVGGGKWAAVVRGRTLEVLNCSKLAIAVPGTNNLQAAALYTPYIMVLPLDRADEYPLDGLAGILPLWLPGIRRLKRAYITWLNEKTSFVSLSNKIAGRMIAPEIRGFFGPEVVARMAVGLLESPERLKEMSRAFWELTHERGASARLAERIAEFAK